MVVMSSYSTPGYNKEGNLSSSDDDEDDAQSQPEGGGSTSSNNTNTDGTYNNQIGETIGDKQNDDDIAVINRTHDADQERM